MKILLVDFDSKIPNLALMKLSAWHKSREDIVGFDTTSPDMVYVSLIFSKNREQAAGLTKMFPNSIVSFGGTGWDLKNFLPPGIETIKPDYDLYPSEYSQGFTTRGCIRKCGFCVVPDKEGRLQLAQHPREFHDDRFDTCMIMDNNLLAAPEEWIKSVFSWFEDQGVKMLSPQGWDARLLTEDTVELLKTVKHPKGLHFAWDDTLDEKKIVSAIRLLKDAGFDLKHNISFYVLAGYETGFEDALYRCNRLREMGTNAFVMRYHKKDRKINKLSEWANRRWMYWSSPFDVIDCAGHVCMVRIYKGSKIAENGPQEVE